MRDSMMAMQSKEAVAPAVAGATTLAAASPSELGLCPLRTARLVDVFKSEIDRKRLPGAVLLMARHGKLALFESLGLQDAQSGVPMALDSIFRIYSMTKPIVSVAVMMLMEQGRLLLDDPVSRYLPGFESQQVGFQENGELKLRPATRGATIQDLLRHTAGLTYETPGNSLVHEQYVKVDIGSRDRNNSELTRALAALPLLFEPGSTWEYSRATDVLGRLVEVLSGQTLGEYLQEHILSPLGMHDTGFSVPPAHHGRIAEPFGRDPDGGEPIFAIDIRRQAAQESGGSGLVSTAMDYARFLQFMLNKGVLDGTRLLGTRTVEFMTADHLGGIPIYVGNVPPLLPPGHGFGLGCAVRTAVGLASLPGSVGMYYWGGIAGTTFFVDPSEDLFALMMIQAPNQRDYYRPLFRDLAYATLID